jgi:hypothetical protein
MKNLLSQLELEHKKLSIHPLYTQLNSIDNLKTFMETHLFAVWDFMALLKSLQKEITCVDVPWTPSTYSKDVVRFINEIVLGEESDLDHEGNPCDHFTLYHDAMREIGADTSHFDDFLKSFNLVGLENYIKEFVSFNMELALGDEPHKTAAAFFYGREKLIPDMFSAILPNLENCPRLIYYIERHIELDGDEHGDLAEKCLISLCGGDDRKLKEAYDVGLKSLELRGKLWDGVLNKLKSKNIAINL